MADRCDIVLESYTYSPGDDINGKVECTFINENKVTAIRVFFNGTARVKWNEGKYTVKEDKRTYFDMESNLLTCETIFKPGIYSYPFKYTLPSNLPSTMAEYYGSIKYKVRVVVDKPWAIDHESKKYFTIVSYNNLNVMDGLLRPREYTEKKVPFAILRETGPITITVNLPRNGFIPNQMIHFSANLKNYSKIMVYEGFGFHVRSSSRSHHSFSGQEFAIIDSSVSPGKEGSWDLQLRVPVGMFIGTLYNCEIISIFWALRGEVCLPFPHKNFVIDVPLVLGNETLRGTNV